MTPTKRKRERKPDFQYPDPDTPEWLARMILGNPVVDAIKDCDDEEFRRVCVVTKVDQKNSSVTISALPPKRKRKERG